MSGTQPVSSIVDFVFVEIRVGLKVQTGENDNGYQWNKERMANAKLEATDLAKKINVVIKKFSKNHPGLEFLPIEKSYKLFEKSMVGYQKFPTLISDEDAKTGQDKPCYFQINHETKVEPTVVFRFKSLPSLPVLNDLRDAISSTVLPK